MAQYNVNHTCGHTELYDIIGPAKKRDYILAMKKSEVCTTCAIEARKPRLVIPVPAPTVVEKWAEAEGLSAHLSDEDVMTRFTSQL